MAETPLSALYSNSRGGQCLTIVGTKGDGQGSLFPAVVKYLVKEHTHPRNIFNALTGENREMKYYFTLATLAHLRDNNRLTHDDIGSLGRGTYLRKDAQNQSLGVLQDLDLISSWTTRRGARLRKKLFPEILKVGK